MFIVGSLNHHKVESQKRLYSDSSILRSIFTKCIFVNKTYFPSQMHLKGTYSLCIMESN